MARQLLRDSNYSLSVSELANKIGVSANYLGKFFYRDRNETLKHYIARKRIERAEIFLANGMPPTEVAQVIGYTNYSAFYSAFFDKHRMSPSVYLKEYHTKR
jgi:AraC-like DNA-binding protein